jgi:hypothetical protein
MNLLLILVYLEYIDSVMNPNLNKQKIKNKNLIFTCIDEYLEFGFGRSPGGK